MPACRFHAYRQCGGDFPGVPVCPEKYGEYDDGSANPCSCRVAEKFCRNIQTYVPAGTPPRSMRRSLWRPEDARIAFALLWAVIMPRCLSGRPPPWGTALPHQETEVSTSAREYDPVVSRYLAGKPAKFCRLTPPAHAGSSHRQAALGGGGQCLILPVSAVANTLKFSMSRLSFASASTGALLLPGRLTASRPVSSGNGHLSFLLLIPVEIDTNENEFQCQLKFSFFSLFLKNNFN